MEWKEGGWSERREGGVKGRKVEWKERGWSGRGEGGVEGGCKERGWSGRREGEGGGKKGVKRVARRKMMNVVFYKLTIHFLCAVHLKSSKFM